jgi:hypothetical protein
VIRIQVIQEPLITEADFEAVQRIMDLKKRKHWRSRTDYEHRFTYNGFLTCSTCGEVIHTALARRDYYACMGRRTAHTCKTKYMGRTKLEGVLDAMFAERLASPSFIRQCVEVLHKRSDHRGAAAERQRLADEVKALQRKRVRVIDGFIEGIIMRGERDQRLTVIDGLIRTAQDTMARESGDPLLETGKLIEVFATLSDWEYWTREQKRLVLSTLIPEIRVSDYKIESLGLNPTVFSNEDTRKGRGIFIAERPLLYLPMAAS